MLFLDWSSAQSVALGMEAPSPDASAAPRTVMTVSMGSGHWSALVDALRAGLRPGGGELRVELPGDWRLFWKLREGDSRLLLAHPQRTSYVGTLALSPVHAAGFLAAAGSLGSAGRVEVGACGRVDPLSNFELALEKLAEGRSEGLV